MLIVPHNSGVDIHSSTALVPPLYQVMKLPVLLLLVSSAVAMPGVFEIKLQKRGAIKQANNTPVDWKRLHKSAERAVAKYQNAQAKLSLSLGRRDSIRSRSNIARRGITSVAVPLHELYDGNDELWYGPASIGNPPQQFTFDFDTGSADVGNDASSSYLLTIQTWITSSACKEYCSPHTFRSSASSTYKRTGSPFSISYGSGDVGGYLATDTFQIGSGSNTLTIPKQYFGDVQSLSPDFLNSPSDGIMGLGYRAISTTGEKTPFENLLAQGVLAEPVFGFRLSRYATDKGAGAEMTIGGTNTAKYDSSTLVFLPVTSKGYWQIELAGADVDGTKISKAGQAAIDTGTTLIIAPPAIAKAIYAKIPGAKLAHSLGDGFYSFPCSTSPKPAVSLNFGGRLFEINSLDFNLGAEAQGSDMCVGAIVGTNVGDSNLWIIGDTFLKNVSAACDGLDCY